MKLQLSKYITSLQCRFFVGVLLLASLASCSDTADDSQPTIHKVGPVKIDVPLSVLSEGQQSRAHNYNDVALSVTDVKEIWVGFFDANDHRFIGSGTKTSGIAATNNQVTIQNLFFADDHEYAHVAMVANYLNVEARLGNGATMPLIDILEGELASWEDFCNIAVDVVSAEQAIGTTRHVLMSGIYYKTAAGAKVTVEADDNGRLTPNPYGSNVLVQMFTYDTGTAFEKAIVLEPNLGLGYYSNYTFLLRPMFSHATVEVNLSGALNRTGGLSWKLCNVPRYVYMIEHDNVEDCSSYTADTWLNVTPAASDRYGADGYYTMTDAEFRTTTNGTTIAGNPPYDVLAGDAVTATSTGYKFGFWHYENKHWGLPSVTTYAQRGATLGGSSDLFSALCPTADKTFNNNATYMVLRVKGTNGTTYDYRVHEGFSTNINNSSATGQARDFSVFRNTNYTYDISISGTSSALKKASRADVELGDDADVTVEVHADNLN